MKKLTYIFFFTVIAAAFVSCQDAPESDDARVGDALEITASNGG